MKNRAAISLLLTTSLLTLLKGYCDPEVVVYRENHSPLTGTIASVSPQGKLELENTTGRSWITLGSGITLMAKDDWPEFSAILSNSNYKQLSRNQFRSSETATPWEHAAVKSFKTFWRNLQEPFQGTTDTVYIIAFRVNPSGTVSNVKVLKSSGQAELEARVIENISELNFPKLPSHYTGPWIPAYIVVDLDRVEKALFLYHFQQHLQKGIEPIREKIQPCHARIDLLVSPAGKLLHSEPYGLKRANSSRFKACSSLALKELAAPLHNYSFQNLPHSLREDVVGISAIYTPQRKTTDAGVHLFFDPEVTETFLKRAIHQYQKDTMTKVVDQEVRKLANAQKVKIGRQNSRYARYLITYSPASWPNLKEITLSSPSGDPQFDRLCTQALKQVKLPALPPVLQIQEQTTTFKCCFWGRD